MKAVPFPSVLRMSTEPPWRWIIPKTIERPRPVPRSPFVKKNGLRQRRRTSSLMPEPVSATSRIASPSAQRVLTVTPPPAGIASTALKIKFVSASRSSDSSPSTGGTAQIGFHAHRRARGLRLIFPARTALHDPYRDRSHERDHQSHRHKKAAAETSRAAFRPEAARAHGKSTRCVAPVRTSTSRSSVRVLLSQALSLWRPAGRQVGEPERCRRFCSR